MLPSCLQSNELTYNITTALFCHRLLEMFFGDKSVVLWDPVFKANDYRFVANNLNGDFPEGYSIVPDIYNATNVAMVCTGLSENECQRWISCSRAARDCCKRQKAAELSETDQEFYCKITWDGVSCLDATPNGTVLDLQCPSYYIPTDDSKTFSTVCLPSGKWKERVIENGTLLVYKTCKVPKKILGAEFLEEHIMVTLVTNLISLAITLPAIAILTLFRCPGNTESRRRTRKMYRIHQHFLLSLILVSIVTLIWDEVIAKEHIVKLHKGASQIDLNSAFCKILHITQRYLRSATYFWMFVEGLNVLIPLLPSFQKEIRLMWIYFIGWGVPLIPIAIYASLRTAISQYDYKCWIYPVLWLEFIIIGPNVISVLCNIIFLVIIVVTIVIKERKTNETRASFCTVMPKPLRALFFLIPLFGLHFILAWVLHVFDGTWCFVVNSVVEGLQGSLVSILWVFCSKQLRDFLRASIERKCPQLFFRFRERKLSALSSTQLTHVVHPVHNTAMAENVIPQEAEVQRLAPEER
ncbi:calcitonin gene-related peptide type 1 receptor-like [Saccostrea echinata]|uniref:calcitonin gene-related peptide type 1 receptor-like n=1 Tax=Saccostrea echinata TaxID=191078 RepID=UPI002A83DFEA|nr:calcitonin gene-related peptide type 1 receptor-like [Saccostrea echinata]